MTDSGEPGDYHMKLRARGGYGLEAPGRNAHDRGVHWAGREEATYSGATGRCGWSGGCLRSAGRLAGQGGSGQLSRSEPSRAGGGSGTAPFERTELSSSSS